MEDLMYSIKLAPLIAILFLIFLPFISRFLKRSFDFGRFADLPLGYLITSDHEIKSLVLLGIVLLSAFLVILILKND
jgi:hypothetical protein